MKKADTRSRRRFLKESSLLGVAVAIGPGISSEALADSKFGTNKKENAMTQTSATQPTSDQTADKTAIRPFPKLKVPEAEITELRPEDRSRRTQHTPGNPPPPSHSYLG